MAITPLPTPPSRTDPTNFATRADAFMAALPTFATETNATAVEVDNDRIASAASASSAATQVTLATAQVALASAQRVLAETAANAASATANVTQWVSGTTYTAGANVWSPINYQTYRRISTGGGTTDPSADSVNWQVITSGLTANDLSGGVQGSLPYQVATGDTAMLAPSTAGYFLSTNGSGANPAWVPPPAGGPNSITTINPMNADIYLTSASNQVQNIFVNASFLSVFLPDATTITTPSSPRFIINNTCTITTSGAAYAYTLAIRRNDGSLVAVVNPGGTAYVALTNNATARGEWTCTGKLLSWTNIINYFSGLPNDFGIAAPPLKLTNGKTIFVVSSGTDTRLIYGSASADAYYANGYYVGLYQISSTQAILVTQQLTNLRSFIVTITDTTLTLTASTVKTTTGTMSTGCMAQINANTYVIAMQISTAIEGIVMTVSGSTTTFGTQTTLKSGLTNPVLNAQGAVGYNSTTALITFNDGVNPTFNINAFAVTVSGTTFTVGATSLLRTGGNTAQAEPRAFIQNGSVLIVAVDTQTSGTCFGAITISGTTLTVGTFVTNANSWAGVKVPFAFNLSTTFYKNWYTTRLRGFCITVSGTTTTIVYTALSSQGFVEDTVNNRMLSLDFPTFEQTNKLDPAGGSNPVVYSANASGLTTTSAQLQGGDVFGGYLDQIILTSGGALYGNRQYGNRMTNLKTMSFSGVFTENYGVSNNIAARNLPTSADDVNPAYSLVIGNVGLVRTAAKVTVVVEMAI